MRSLPNFVLGLLLIATSILLALIFFNNPKIIEHTGYNQGDWTFGYWFLTVILGAGGMLIAGLSGEPK